MPTTNEQEHKAIKESIDKLIVKFDKAMLLMNGNGKLGFFGKVNILWGGSLFLITVVIATLIRTFLK